jgi:hypothetical protein
MAPVLSRLTKSCLSGLTFVRAWTRRPPCPVPPSVGDCRLSSVQDKHVGSRRGEWIRRRDERQQTSLPGGDDAPCAGLRCYNVASSVCCWVVPGLALQAGLGRLEVNRTLLQLDTGEVVVKGPKTARGRRTAAPTPTNAVALGEHFESEAARRSDGPDHYVFAHACGSPLRADYVTRLWRDPALKHGLRPIRLHDSRHSQVSAQLRENVHPAIVAQRLGHGGVQVTLNVYSHLTPDLQETAPERFDAGLKEKSKSPGN